MEFPTFDSSIKELEKIEYILDKNYPQNTSILNRNIGIYKIFKNIISNLRLLKDLDSKECATQPFATLSRMIIDNYSILYLISKHSDSKEQDLRYYLYLMDSLNGRINSITNFSDQVQNNSLIKDFKESKDTIEHDERAINTITKLIEKNKLDELVPKKVIEDRNWKFTTGIKSKKNRLSWIDLYNIARIPNKFSEIIQNHYSTYTHGLGMTILYESRNDTFFKSTFLLLTLLNLNIARILIDEYKLQPGKMNLDPEFLIYVKHQWENYHKWT